MSWRLDDIPIFEMSTASVAAADYNLVQLAFHRLGEPLYLPLTGLRSLELVLDHEAWVVVDRDQNDMPVLAWTDFQRQGRSALHEAVPCHLKTYHVHAPVILDQVTAFLEQELAKRIAEKQQHCDIENVTPLKRRD
jgi:hypothetical protein